ncbi:MAG: amino acid racemase [Chloroflexi bacterium]|nr:amino acid racemase [Chloroflexota bacterium]
MVGDKPIGIVAGVGPFAGLDLLGKILAETAVHRDQDHLPIYSLSQPDEILDRTEYLLGIVAENPAYAIAGQLQKLAAMGAQVAGIPCNTAHAAPIFDVIMAELRAANCQIHLLHMIREVGRHLRDNHPAIQTVGVLSTTGTYRAQIYPQMLGEVGFIVLAPDEAMQAAQIHPAIYDPVYGIKATGAPTNQARAQLMAGARALRQQGAEAVILGCTEIPLAIETAQIHDMIAIDPTRILARALIREARRISDFGLRIADKNLPPQSAIRNIGGLMPRIRELGIYDGRLPTGPLNAITDVVGVAVGHFTLVEGEGAWTGHGPFRTGVTVVLPHLGNLYAEKVAAAVHTINGYGKVIGFEQVRELGNLETPIALTGTLNGPRVADALISVMIAQNPHIGLGFAATGRQGYASVNPVVGETSDGFLSDMQARPIGETAVYAALASATTGPVAEGVVGAGTGTSCYGWKGGIGTASRRLPPEQGRFIIGALVQSNFGSPEELTIAGVNVGAKLRPEIAGGDRGLGTGQGNQPSALNPHPRNEGSIMVVLATDAPLDARQLGRLCRRAAFGLARTGSTGHGGSGDFVIAFSTAYRILDRPEKVVGQRPFLDEQPIMSALSLAVIESVEEAIYNSLLMAHTVVGRDGNTRYGLPAEAVLAVIRSP